MGEQRLWIGCILAHFFLLFAPGIQVDPFFLQFSGNLVSYNQKLVLMESEDTAFPDFDEETKHKLDLIFGKGESGKWDFPNIKNWKLLIIILLKKLPKEVLEAFKDYAKQETKPATEFQIRKQFENWGETVQTTCNHILYATIELTEGNWNDDLEFIRSKISSLQEFVTANHAGPKRKIRGAGIRHSWANVFTDPGQNLISFYPYNIATGNSFQLEKWAVDMGRVETALAAENVEHLNMLRRVGEVTQGGVKKTLVKIGAGVSNEQMRLWCLAEKLQYKSNVIMVEVNVVGAIGTCSHGAGIDTQTLSDYVYAIEFLDHTGKRQIINKKDQPELILSAASNLGLLGIMLFVTLEMEDLQVVEFVPRSSYKDYIIPWPKDYPHVAERRQRRQYKIWHILPQNEVELNWNKHFEQFKKALEDTYCEWFYFPCEGFRVFQNNWNAIGRNEDIKPEVEGNIQAINPNGIYHADYPPQGIKKIGELATLVGEILANNLETQSAINALMRIPFAFFPSSNTYVNYPDAVHFQRGIQNMKVRDIEVEINIPSKNINGKLCPDYDLIQRIWWASLEYVEDKKEDINVALEMRVFRGSNATLAPEIGYEYVCSIELLRTLTLTPEQQETWRKHSLAIFKIWTGILDSEGKPVLVRPHWGKEWSDIPEIKQHVLNDAGLKVQFKKFLEDYKKIADNCGFKAEENLAAFSNQLYLELLNNAYNRFPVYRHHAVLKDQSWIFHYSLNPQAPEGYTLDGIPYYVPSKDEFGVVPILKFYKDVEGSPRRWLYTNAIQEKYGKGWIFDGVAFPGFMSQSKQTVRIHTWHYGDDYGHRYQSTSEKIPPQKEGWKQDGILFRAYPGSIL